MRNNWLFFMDLDGGSSNMLPMDTLVPHTLGAHLLYHISSFVDSSLYHARFLYAPGSLALRGAFNSVSKFAGALLFWFASGSNSNINRTLSGNSVSDNKSYKSLRQVKQITSTRHNLKGFHYNSRSKGVVPIIFGKVSSFTVGKLCKQAEQLQYLPLLSLAAALVPPLDNVSPSVLAIPLENCDIETKRCMNQRLCDVEHRECSDLSFRNLNWTHAVEPRTGIEFPTILENILSAENHSKFSSEVLVGTGSRTMTIIRIKSLKVYAFGFYIHPYDVCEKLGLKYASIPVGELNKHKKFYEDLLREDINMTVRLVINCNGIKISTVKE